MPVNRDIERAKVCGDCIRVEGKLLNEPVGLTNLATTLHAEAPITPERVD